MARSHKILGFLLVTLLGAYGCAKGPGAAVTTENNATTNAKVQKLEEDYRSAVAARDQFRQKLATSEEQSAKAKKELELQLEQTKIVAATERDALKAEVRARTGERDMLQTQYEMFRKTLREMLGTADTVVGKLNLPAQQSRPASDALGAARN